MKIPEIIPVIHVLNYNQVKTNIKTCIDCGINKVFLINHEVSVDTLLLYATKIKEENPNLWVGINMLGISIDSAISKDLPYDGLWCDETMKPEYLELRRFKGLLFSGIAFKYQPQPKDLEQACNDAITLTDVATTSGLGTGKAANTDKMNMIREYLGTHKMAIASGVSVDNVHLYTDADYLMVASSITSYSEMTQKDKLLELVEKLKSL